MKFVAFVAQIFPSNKIATKMELYIIANILINSVLLYVLF